MAIVTTHIHQQRIHQSTPPTITVFIPRFDLVLGWIALLAGLALPALMVLGVFIPGFWLGLLAFLMVFSAASYLLIRSGEIA
ncbi:MAG: hypothetical protein ROW48_15830 [Bellilinea sp.]|jgi:hypothetical protein